LATKQGQKLKNKKILITAGPTWVAIDSVRVISNIATGETGILLAQALSKLGARVTLLLGPGQACCIGNKIKLIRYKFFSELKEAITKELKARHYDIFIHSAAVSDYAPRKIYSQKVKSGIRNWQLALKPTEKIINLIKRTDRSLLVVGFKFQPQAKKGLLLQKAKELICQANLDLVVANTVSHGKYQAYIIDSLNRVRSTSSNKKNLVLNLIRVLLEE